MVICPAGNIEIPRGNILGDLKKKVCNIMCTIVFGFDATSPFDDGVSVITTVYSSTPDKYEPYP